MRCRRKRAGRAWSQPPPRRDQGEQQRETWLRYHSLRRKCEGRRAKQGAAAKKCHELPEPPAQRCCRSSAEVSANFEQNVAATASASWLQPTHMLEEFSWRNQRSVKQHVLSLPQSFTSTMSKPMLAHDFKRPECATKIFLPAIAQRKIDGWRCRAMASARTAQRRTPATSNSFLAPASPCSASTTS